MENHLNTPAPNTPALNTQKGMPSLSVRICDGISHHISVKYGGTLVFEQGDNRQGDNRQVALGIAALFRPPVWRNPYQPSIAGSPTPISRLTSEGDGEFCAHMGAGSDGDCEKVIDSGDMHLNDLVEILVMIDAQLWPLP